MSLVKYSRLTAVIALALLTSPRVIAHRPAKAPFAPDELIVRFASGVSANAADVMLAPIGARRVQRYPLVDNLHLVRIPPGMEVADAIARLRSQPGVLYAEPNYAVKAVGIPNDSQFSSQWSFHNTGQSGGTPDADIDAPEAWDITTGSSSVVVAVIDTGIDYTHSDLVSNIFRNEPECGSDPGDDDENGYADDCYGIDVVNNDSDPFDDSGHGTHVSGIIGAVGNNGSGVVGVNWNVKMLSCKALDANGHSFMSWVLPCLNYVAIMKDRGVNIIATNNSWDSPFFSQALVDAVEAHRQRGILFVGAAGDFPEDHDRLDGYTGRYHQDLTNAIVAAATTRTDTLASFSAFGRATVHVGAPGTEILSTTLAQSYQSMSGTSMAAAHVSGVAALLKAQDPSRDWRAIRNLLLAGGDDLVPLMGKTVTGKRLNAFGSLTCANKVVNAKALPGTDQVIVPFKQNLTVAVLHINCAQPNGNVIVSVTAQTDGASDRTVTLVDDGVAPDRVAGDGVYSGGVAFPSPGAYTVMFPDGQQVAVQVLRDYSFQQVPFEYRTFTGTSLDVDLDQSKPLTTPFPIRFGGGSFTQLHLSPAGVVGILRPHRLYINEPLPYVSPQVNVAAPQIFVAVFWDDLYPTYPTTGNDHNVFWTVLGASPNRELAIEWRNLPPYGCRFQPGGFTFQVVFFENSSRVLINYANLIMGGGCTFSDRGGSATIGIQVGPGRATQQSFDQAVIDSNTSFLWTANGFFTDESLTGFTVRAIHITELRNRINAVRIAHGLSPFPWTEPSLVTGASVVRAVHIQELRTALNGAYVAAGRTPPTYTDPGIIVGSMAIKAVHVMDLRNAVTELE
jgi:subtilisin family serine protease